MKTLQSILFASAVSLLSFNALAQAPDAKDNTKHWVHQDSDLKGGDREMGPMGMHHEPIEKALDLTDTQKKTLHDARAKEEPSMHELHEKIRAAHEALDKAGSSNADDAALTKLANDFAALMAQQEIARIKSRRLLVSILTPEQKQKFDALESEHKDMSRWHEKLQDKPSTTK